MPASVPALHVVLGALAEPLLVWAEGDCDAVCDLGSVTCDASPHISLLTSEGASRMLVTAFMTALSGVLDTTESIGRGTSQDIVAVLSAYRRSLPTAFLAHVLKRSTVDLQNDLQLLSQRHVVRVDGETVRLL